MHCSLETALCFVLIESEYAKAPNKGETPESDSVQRVKVGPHSLGPKNPAMFWKLRIFTQKNRTEKLVTRGSDQRPRVCVRIHVLDGRSEGHGCKARSMELQTSNRCDVLGANVEMHRSQKEVSHGRDPDLVHQGD